MAITAIQVDFLKAGVFLHGNPLSRGWIKTYTAGTSTPVALYSAADKSTSHTNPLQLDDDGQAVAFGDGAYKFEISDENLVITATIDNLTYRPIPTGVFSPTNMGPGSGLNADLVDGYHAGNSSGMVPVNNGTVNTNLNADMVDGYHITSIVRKDDAAAQALIGPIVLPNNIYYYAKDNVGGNDTVLGQTAANVIEVGNAARALNLRAVASGLFLNGTAIEFSALKIVATTKTVSSGTSPVTWATGLTSITAVVCSLEGTVAGPEIATAQPVAGNVLINCSDTNPRTVHLIAAGI